MKLAVNRAEILAVYVRVYLRRGDVCVSEHFLHRAKICPSFEKMGRERMSKGMRRNRFCNTGNFHVFAEDFPRAHSRQRLSPRVQEKNSLAFTSFELRSQRSEER